MEDKEEALEEIEACAGDSNKLSNLLPSNLTVLRGGVTNVFRNIRLSFLTSTTQYKRAMPVFDDIIVIGVFSMIFFVTSAAHVSLARTLTQSSDIPCAPLPRLALLLSVPFPCAFVSALHPSFHISLYNRVAGAVALF